MQLAKNTKVTVLNVAVAAGQDDNSDTTTYVDMQGYEGVMIIATIGAITSTGTIEIDVRQCATSGGTYVEMSGSSTTLTGSANSNELIIADIYKPTDRYVNAHYTRAASQDVVIGGIIAIQYNGHKAPTTVYTAANTKALVSPAEV